MKKFYLIAGIIFSIWPFFLASDDLEDYRVQQLGQVVEMKIIRIPGSCLGTKTKYFMELEFNKKVFLKRIGGSYCESHNVGDVVQVKYLPGKNKILFPDESVVREFIASAILVLVGVYSVFLGLKKDAGSL